MLLPIRAVTNLRNVLTVAMFALLATTPAFADAASPDDTARFLAGMPPSAESPLGPLTRQSGWRLHARLLDSAWQRLEDGQLRHVRAWSGQHLPEPQSMILYMFSGPDFLYADALFPRGSTYVLSGLEPVGSIPDIARLTPGAIDGQLGRLRGSLSTVLSYGFFITKKMRSQLETGHLNGTLPVLYVFLARSGKTIHDVRLVSLDEEGKLSEESPGQKGSTKGVKITFSGGDGRPRTLYYFSTDLSDGGVKNSGFLTFCAQQGSAHSLIKSASYLMHSGNFSSVRSFLLEHSNTILQDDSGVPVSYFRPEDWNLQAFGSYPGPISIFRDRYQAKLSKLFQSTANGTLPFSFGYRWRPRESNLLLATRASARTVQSP